MYQNSKMQTITVKFIQAFFFVFALILSIGSFGYLIFSKDLIFKNFWIDSDTGNFIAYIGILATSAFSILIYFVSLNTLKMNEQLFQIEKTRFRIDMLPIKQKQKHLNLTITECKTLLHEISSPLNDYIFHESKLESLHEEHKKWVEALNQELENCDPAEKLMKLVNPPVESPLHIQNKNIKNQLKDNTYNLQTNIGKCIQHFNTLEDIFTSEIQAILNIDFDLVADMHQFLHKERIESWSLKRALDDIKQYSDIGIISDVPYSDIFLSAVNELKKYSNELDELNSKVKKEIGKLYI